MDTQILPSDEVTKVESRSYLNPQVALDESNTFIDNLRSTQGQQNQEIFTDTQMLGTDVPSVQGGLTGGNSYFTSRYQTPQTNAATANLRAAAQATALNQVLQNEQEIWKKKYQDAYRNYQKRQYNRAYGGGGGNSGGGDDDVKEKIETDDTTKEIGNIETEGIAKSRYQKLFMKYIQAGYPASEAEARAKEDFGKAIDVDAPVEPYGGQ